MKKGGILEADALRVCEIVNVIINIKGGTGQLSM